VILRPDFQDPRRLERELAPLGAQDRVRLVCERGCTILTTSFGPTSGALLGLVRETGIRVPVVTVRHGHETRQTLEMARFFEREFSLNLQVYSVPKEPVPEFGTPGFRRYCRKVKEEPLRAALRRTGATIWLSGLMHDESARRDALPLVRRRYGVLAVYPILDWRQSDALEYCLRRDIPVNNDYYDPCKGPSQDLECGIHFDQDHGN